MNYALIGCGRIAVNHLNAARNNGLDIVAVCDLKPEAIDSLFEKTEYDGEPDRYTDYKQMISEHPELDFAAIATDSGSHAEIALYCIQHDLPVIIEKPMAMSMQDANAIVCQSRERKVPVAVCHQNRFNEAVQETRKAMESGRFGKLSHGTIHVRWNRGPQYYEQASWRGRWATDGGCLMNQCIHGIDLLRWMLGGEVEEVYGLTRQQFHDYLECEDLGTAIVKFKNGAVGIIEGTVNVYPRNLEETLYLFGEKGTVKLGGKSTNTIDVWNFQDEESGDADKAGFHEKTVNVYGNGHILLYKDMIEALETGRAPYIGAEAGRDAVEMILAIYKSSATGKPVKLPLSDVASVDFEGLFSYE